MTLKSANGNPEPPVIPQPAQAHAAQPALARMIHQARRTPSLTAEKKSVQRRAAARFKIWLIPHAACIPEDLPECKPPQPPDDPRATHLTRLQLWALLNVAGQSRPMSFRNPKNTFHPPHDELSNASSRRIFNMSTPDGVIRLAISASSATDHSQREPIAFIYQLASLTLSGRLQPRCRNCGLTCGAAAWN